MSNVVSKQKQEQIVALGQLGWPLRRIERELDVRRETAGAYLRRAGVAVRLPGRWGHAAPEAAAKPAIEVSTDLEAAIEMSTDPPRRKQVSLCEPHREFIEGSLLRGRNAMGIWQHLVDNEKFSGDYASVKRFVRGLRGKTKRQPHEVITTAPGVEAQVDYGEGPLVRDPVTGSFKKTRLFVMTLGFSRKSVRLLSFESSAEVWARLHEIAFRRLGGAPALVVLDNLKEGVKVPEFFDPEHNLIFAAMLSHYGSTSLPCRVRHPDRKGKVESGVGHAQKTPLAGMRFETLGEAQAYLDDWEQRWADTRIHGTVKRQVAGMFVEEKPHLKPLPIEPFRYFQHGKRIVTITGFVEVEAAYYEAPPGTVNDEVAVQWDDRHVRILDLKSGQLLVEHLRQERGKHRRRDESKKTGPPALDELQDRAKRAGEHVALVCVAIHDDDKSEAGDRRIRGVLHLVKKHGKQHVDDVCEVALTVGAPTYRFVKKYLEHHPPVQLTLRQVDPLIRQLTEYRDVVARLTAQENT
jgi:transposase